MKFLSHCTLLNSTAKVNIPQDITYSRRERQTWSSDAKKNFARIAVHVTGTCIAPYALPHVFELFGVAIKRVPAC